jgi:hypothetical protein
MEQPHRKPESRGYPLGALFLLVTASGLLATWTPRQWRA